MEFTSGQSTPPVSFWPDGKKYALALTHDVDSKDGFGNIDRFASLEARVGLQSCWYVPSHRYALDHGLLASLFEAGHEIGCHGYNHDNRIAFLTEAEIETRLAGAFSVLDRYNVQGFRSPSLIRSEALFKVASRFFKYDSSVSDTERMLQFAEASGACTVFPYYADNRLLEIPCTLPLENVLMYIGHTPENILRVWLKKLDWIKRIGGVAVFTTHTEPQFSGNRDMLDMYRILLDHLSEERDAWIETPGRIAAWWQSRNEVE